MPLIPPDSRTRKIHVSVPRRVILYLDGIRYSFEIFELASSRLAHILHNFDRGEINDGSTGAAIVSATTDAWTMVDATHRLRELLQQTPGLKQKDPELQLFLRSTASVEQLRHYFQHFRTEINSFHERGLPLWGSLTWGSIDSETKTPKCHTLVPGTFFDGAWATTPTFDSKAFRFIGGVSLNAGPESLDLTELHRKVERISEWYIAWFEGTFGDDPHHGSDVHMKLEIRPVQEGDPETDNGGA